MMVPKRGDQYINNHWIKSGGSVRVLTTSRSAYDRHGGFWKDTARIWSRGHDFYHSDRIPL